MDEVLCKFDQATDLELDQSSLPEFSNLYKNRNKIVEKQQERRNELLSNRLKQRDKVITSLRRLVSDLASDDEAPSRSAEATSARSSHAEDRKFRNKAMLSEWLIDRPMDFESEWILKATPVGRRCLVFARKGETVAYSRTGQFIKAFQSSLPGGCHMHVAHCRRQFAIVDGIYVQHTNSYYLMDALAWNEHKLYESEASFRFFWLQSRYNENEEKFLTVGPKNQSRFYCLNTYSASDQDILTALNSDPLIKGQNLQLDGLLFFHVRGPYVPGANPLVLWLKPEMVGKVLNIDTG